MVLVRWYYPHISAPSDQRFYYSLLLLSFNDWFDYFIRLTSPCNVDPLTPHFYKVKLGLTGVFIFSYFCSKKHRSRSMFTRKNCLTEAVLTCTNNLCVEQTYEKSRNFSIENCNFYSHEQSLYIAWACIVMLVFKRKQILKHCLDCCGP